VMNRSRRRARGYTLIEVMIVVALVGILAAASVSYIGGFRRRVSLQSMVHELDALMGEARLRAIEDGRDVAVLFFPPAGARQGRVVVYEDGGVGATSFFDAGAPVNFGNLNPLAPVAGAGSTVVDALDMPAGVNIGLSNRAALPAPLDAIPVNTPCSFCGPPDSRGAVVFNMRGRARLQSGVGAALPGAGGSITFVDPQKGRWILVLSTSGAVQLVNDG